MLPPTYPYPGMGYRHDWHKHHPHNAAIREARRETQRIAQAERNNERKAKVAQATQEAQARIDAYLVRPDVVARRAAQAPKLAALYPDMSAVPRRA